jgi:FKBP-type peptidyl-prolyl cis-trans isomerase
MMTFRLGAALLGASMMLTACSNGGGAGSYDSASLESSDAKASYGVGLNIGGQLADAKDRLDRAAFMRGIEDAMQGREPAVPGEEIQASLQAFSAEIEAAAAEQRDRQATENAAAGAAYLAENGAREGVTTTASGLQYEVLRAADGPTASEGQQVQLHYRGTLIDGREFDSSYGGDPAVFRVGGMIEGFDEALLLMPVGSHYRVVIPSDIAYGPQARSALIGPNSTLIFEIELLDIVD